MTVLDNVSVSQNRTTGRGESPARKCTTKKVQPNFLKAPSPARCLGDAHPFQPLPDGSLDLADRPFHLFHLNAFSKHACMATQQFQGPDPGAICLCRERLMLKLGKDGLLMVQDKAAPDVILLSPQHLDPCSHLRVADKSRCL